MKNRFIVWMVALVSLMFAGGLFGQNYVRLTDASGFEPRLDGLRQQIQNRTWKKEK